MNKKGISLTIALALISLQLGLGIVLGYFTARFLAGKQAGQQGRVRSLTFQISDYKLHLHHWLLSLGLLAFAFFFNLFQGGDWTVFNFLYGFIGGWIIQGVFSYKDWKRILIKRSKDDQGRGF
jgi:xanthine/uracil permease